MLFYVPEELREFIDFTVPGWRVKDTANEEQRKEVDKILKEMKKEEEKMLSISK